MLQNQPESGKALELLYKIHSVSWLAGPEARSWLVGSSTGSWVD